SVLYVALIAAVFYVVDRRAFARETPAAHAADREQTAPLRLHGAHNLAWLLAVVRAAFLKAGGREAALLAIRALSYFATSKEVHARNQLSFAPMQEVALLFAGIFVCLAPVEAALAKSAGELPLQHAWQLFWGSGVLSAVLDNAPTYAAFAALARGL